MKRAKRVTEPSRRLPVMGAWDVVVAGGGVAGVAAAVAAARTGASVCLLERMGGLGGLATLGHVVVWLPLCDGRGRQVMAGLPEELLRLSVADLRHENRDAGFVPVPSCWEPGGDLQERKQKRYKASFNPAAYLLALETMVVEAGVTLYYDTRACALLREGREIRYVIVENKSGRTALACRCAIDATGDADLCHGAGETTESLDGNVATGWFYTHGARGLRLHKWSHRYDRSGGREGARERCYRGDDAGDVTAQILATRVRIRAMIAAQREAEPDGDCQVLALPGLACLRMTRRLVGSFSLGEQHRHQWFDDTVGLTGDWRKAGPVYAIPWRVLHGRRTRNLLAAGRCLSVDRTLWDATRAIPTCALTGAAAGTAAALAVRFTRGDVLALPVDRLQRELVKQGFLLDPGLVHPAPDHL